jgi:hypothetical protein
MTDIKQDIEALEAHIRSVSSKTGLPVMTPVCVGRLTRILAALKEAQERADRNFKYSFLSHSRANDLALDVRTREARICNQRREIARLEAQLQEQALGALAADTQAQQAYDAQRSAEAKLARAVELLKRAPMPREGRGDWVAEVRAFLKEQTK